MKKYLLLFFTLWCIGCTKKKEPTPGPPPGSFYVTSVKVNDQPAGRGNNFFNVNASPVIKISFTAPVDHATVNNNLSWVKNPGVTTAFNISYENNDSMVVIRPTSVLQSLSKYILTLTIGVLSKQGIVLAANNTNNLITAIDSTDKFSRISDSALIHISEPTRPY